MLESKIKNPKILYIAAHVVHACAANSHGDDSIVLVLKFCDSKY